MVKPILKWAGGKRSLLKYISPLISEHNNITSYYEPFVGGGAVMCDVLSKTDKKVFINDINTDLINVYKQLKEKPTELLEQLQIFEQGWNIVDVSDRPDIYYQNRGQHNDFKQSDVYSATQMIFLNKTCFNGLYRVNKSGGFNSPCGDLKDIDLCGNVGDLSAVFSRVEITSTDFSEIKPTEQSLFYFDPPYKPIGDKNFTAYHKSGFNDSDHIRLRDYVTNLSNLGHKVIISSSSHEFIKDIYSNFNIIEIGAKRSINCDKDGRGEVKELLITNF